MLLECNFVLRVCYSSATLYVEEYDVGRKRQIWSSAHLSFTKSLESRNINNMSDPFVVRDITTDGWVCVCVCAYVCVCGCMYVCMCVSVCELVLFLKNFLVSTNFGNFVTNETILASKIRILAPTTTKSVKNTPTCMQLFFISVLSVWKSWFKVKHRGQPRSKWLEKRSREIFQKILKIFEIFFQDFWDFWDFFQDFWDFLSDFHSLVYISGYFLHWHSVLRKKNWEIKNYCELNIL